MIFFKKNLNYLEKKSFLVLVVLFSFLILTFFKVPFIFFQQDEWMGFGLIIDQGVNILTRGLGSETILHFIPIGQLLNYVAYQIFGLNYQAYNFTGLLIHFINACLLYKLGLMIFQKRIYSLISSLIFLTSSIPFQLLMWPLVSLNTLSLTFILISLILIYKISKSEQVFKLGLLSLLSVTLSLLILEYALGLLILAPFIYLYLYQKTHNRQFLYLVLLFALVSFIYFGVRMHPFLNNSNKGGNYNNQLIQFIASKATRLPFKYIGQIFVSEESVKALSKVIANQTTIHEESIYGKLTGSLGLLIIILSAVVFKVIKSQDLRENQVFILFYIVFSSLPFLFLPGAAGNFNLFPPRYLYYGTVGSALLLSFCLYYVNLNKNTFFKILLGGFVVITLFLNVWQNTQKEEKLVRESNLRLSILNHIKQSYPSLSQKTIFYTRSDNSYYGLPENELILPFQSGFGQIILVWYQAGERFPKSFFENRFLWEITDQGYQEIGNRGFGYFRNIEKMGQSLSNEKLNQIKFIAFNFSSQDNELSDISNEIKGELNGYLAKKQLTSPKSFFLKVSENPSDTTLMLDNDRNTFWQSDQTYDKLQTIEFDLKYPTKVAQIELDSYTNKNQDKTGYEVYLSDDKYKWERVFSAKRYPPNLDGITNIYIQPRSARYIRLKQIGTHQYAKWVINELKLYETIN